MRKYKLFLNLLVLFLWPYYFFSSLVGVVIFERTSFLKAPTVFLLPLLVLALCLVLWPLAGRPLVCLIPLYDPIFCNLDIFDLTVLTRSPSIRNDSTLLVTFVRSSPVKSFTRLASLIESPFKILLDVDIPIPLILVRRSEEHTS